MIGATAKAEQFQSRSGSESTKGSRKGFGLLGGGDDPVSQLNESERLQNEHASIKRLLCALNHEMAHLNGVVRREARFKRPSFFLALAERDKVKLELHAAQNAATELRKALGRGGNTASIERHFVDVAKELLTASQFKQILAEAKRRAPQLPENPA